MTAVDRLAVQDLIEARIARHTRLRKNEYDKGYEDALEVLLIELAEFPSSNAQAVAWQRRYVYPEESQAPNSNWMYCSKANFDANAQDEGKAYTFEYRALCVCSGDAKEA